jgi:hypothetical protein
MKYENLYKKFIENQLKDLSLQSKLNIYNELDLSGDDCYYYEDFDELIETYFYNDPAGAARAVYFGKVFLNDDYFTLDVYGNIKSYTDYTLSEELGMILKDRINDILKLDNYIIEQEFEVDELNDFVEQIEEVSSKQDEYINLSNEKQKMFNEFFNKYGFSAFNQAQFENGLSKLNCKESDLLQIFNGCFILKDKKEEYHNLCNNLDVSSDLLNDPELMQSAIYYELNNYEYIVGFDPEYTRQEVLGVLGLKLSDPGVKSALIKACNLIDKEADYIY